MVPHEAALQYSFTPSIEKYRAWVRQPTSALSLDMGLCIIRTAMFFRSIEANPFWIRQGEHQLEVYARPDGDEQRRRADATVSVRRPPHLEGQASKTVCYGWELRLATPTAGNELGRQPWLLLIAKSCGGKAAGGTNMPVSRD